MARCAGPEARWILLSAAEPMELSSGWSHSRPARESQPSGFKRSATYCVRHAASSLCQELSCEAAGAGSSESRIAMKVRQAERSLKRMRKYNVDEKALKMKMRKKEHARACGRSFGGEVRGTTGSSPSSRNIHSWHHYFRLSTRSALRDGKR